MQAQVCSTWLPRSTWHMTLLLCLGLGSSSAAAQVQGVLVYEDALLRVSPSDEAHAIVRGQPSEGPRRVYTAELVERRGDWIAVSTKGEIDGCYAGLRTEGLDLMLWVHRSDLAPALGESMVISDTDLTVRARPGLAVRTDPDGRQAVVDHALSVRLPTPVKPVTVFSPGERFERTWKQAQSIAVPDVGPVSLVKRPLPVEQTTRGLRHATDCMELLVERPELAAVGRSMPKGPVVGGVLGGPLTHVDTWQYPSGTPVQVEGGERGVLTQSWTLAVPSGVVERPGSHCFDWTWEVAEPRPHGADRTLRLCLPNEARTEVPALAAPWNTKAFHHSEVTWSKQPQPSFPKSATQDEASCRVQIAFDAGGTVLGTRVVDSVDCPEPFVSSAQEAASRWAIRRAPGAGQVFVRFKYTAQTAKKHGTGR
jgi:hypothetical protein